MLLRTAVAEEAQSEDDTEDFLAVSQVDGDVNPPNPFNAGVRYVEQ